MSSSRVLLLLGAGPNIGLHTTRIFKQQGFKVALAARSPSEELSKQADVTVKADFAEPSSISEVFKEVVSKLGHPSVVIYNAAVPFFSDASDPFSQPFSEVQSAIAINYYSPYVAAQEAVKSFKASPSDVKKTFLFTGNALNIGPIPGLLAFGAAKSASAHMIANAAMVYPDSAGYRFYFVDERKADGAPKGPNIGGEAHAKEFLLLSEAATQRPWNHTFVEGKGYADFSKSA